MKLQMHYSNGTGKEDYLFWIFNTLGYKDLELMYHYTKPDGSIGWSRWVRYDKLISMGYGQRIPGMQETKREFIRNVCHRTISDVEVVFDLDDLKKNGSVHYYTLSHKAHDVMQGLKKEGYEPVLYSTGNKGYHIHIIIPELRNMTKEQRRQYKTKLLKKYDAELLKASERCPIMLEGTRHRKSGQYKREVEII